MSDKIQVWTPYNVKKRPKIREKVDSLPLTEPEQAKTVRQLLNDHLRGLPVDVKNGLTRRDVLINGRHLKSFDLTELDAIQRENVEHIMEQQRLVKKSKDEAKQKDLQREIERRVKEELAKKEADSTNIP